MLARHGEFGSGLRVCGRSSVVERQLPKLNVGGSIPLARSNRSLAAAAVPEAPGFGEREP